MDTQTQDYAARLEIDFWDRLDRVSSVFRLILWHGGPCLHLLKEHPEGRPEGDQSGS